MARVSVAMATYNGGKYLRPQLESFLTQHRLPDEVIVRDDASIDDTVEILQDFRQRANFEVKIAINANNVGYVKNFEYALADCTGDLIFLSDQDDIWFDEKIEKIEAQFAAASEVEVFVNDQLIVDEELKGSGMTKLGHIRRLGLSDDSLITGCCTALRRSWRDFVLPFPAAARSHDGWISSAASLCGVKAVLDTPLQYYRRHESNTSQWLASSVRPIGSFELAKQMFASRKADDFVPQLHLMSELLLRIGERGVFGGRAAAIQQAAERLGRRNEVLMTSGVSRVAGVLGMWLGGDYGAYNGWRSVVMDLLR